MSAVGLMALGALAMAILVGGIAIMRYGWVHRHPDLCFIMGPMALALAASMVLVGVTS